MIKNLILDIGNVICEWNPERLSASVTDNAQDAVEAMEATIKHPDWLDLDRGILSVDQAIENALTRTQLDEKVISAVYTNLPKSMPLIEATANAMSKATDAGIPIYILSNMQHHAWEYLREAHACFGLCTGVVVSCEAQLIKPDPEIYHYLCKQYALTPSECLFIDDMLENVEAARDCGWQAEQLESVDKSEALMKEVLSRFST